MSTNLQQLIDQLVGAAAALDPAENGGVTTSDLGLRLGHLKCARNQLTEFLAGLPRVHVVVLREDDWVLEHPLACRSHTDLTGCPFNDELNVFSHEAAGDVPLGRYEVALVDGELVFGDAV